MRTIMLLFFLGLLLPALSQTNSAGKKVCIEGTIYEKKDQRAVHHAIVKLLNITDSTSVTNTASDAKGCFKIWAIEGVYRIQIAYLGFDNFDTKIEIGSQSDCYNLGKIELNESSILLNEATIEAKTPNVMVKGDTIEFNAAAYTTDQSDLLRDVIKNLGGVEIDKDGNVTANGKPVQKILVDGKEFFGNDMVLALNNLPASMIRKIQFYKEDSETAKTTGFKDNDPEQVINLVVKEELKKSTFGNIMGGYGSNQHYISKFNVNHMRGENQTSAFGNVNNVNNDGSDYSLPVAGIETNKLGAINTHIAKNEKFKIGLNMRLADNITMDETQENSVLFDSKKGDFYTKEDNTNRNQRTGWNGGLSLRWIPDTLTYVHVRTDIGISNTHSLYARNSLSYHINQSDTVKSTTDNSADGNALNMTNSLVMGRKLGSTGRAISLSVRHSLRNDHSDGSNYSITNAGTTKETVINQKLKTESRNNTINLSANYVEPLAKDLLAQLLYNVNNNDSKRMRNTHKKDANGNYTLIDTAYTRDTENTYVNQNIGFSIQLNKSKYRLSGGISIDPTYSLSKVTSPDTVIETKQHVVNFSPNFNFYYAINPNTSFSINYSGSSNQPSLSQLSADTSRTATAKQVGNPSLKPSFENALNFLFQKSDFESNRYLIISGSVHQTMNDIVDDTSIDSDLNSLNTYQNLNGKMGANFGATYDTPLKNKKFTFNTSTNGNYYRNVGLMNKTKTKTDNISISENISLRFKSKQFESRLQALVSHTIVKNNLSNRNDETTTNYGVSNFTYVKLPLDFTIQSDVSFKYYDGYGSDFKKNETLWNASISKLFLKQKAGTLKLQFYDILNNRNTLIRNISGSGITDSKSNSINRYFMLSFSYRFNFMKKGTNEPDESVYDEF